MENVRVRIAPSPTGYLHLGTARTALFNYLFARQHGGEFLIRIEDTDQARNSEAMTQGIIDGLKWLGLESDEPIRFQSEDANLHTAIAMDLVRKGKAYCDFTPKQTHALNYEKHHGGNKIQRANPFRDMPFSEQMERVGRGEPFSVRLKVPWEGEVVFQDLVFGKQRRAFDDIPDLVLLRQDSTPLYNLAVVADDHNMGITHIIRGQDHLTNTHSQVLIYQALGWTVPIFSHLPLINAPGKKKLSKRIHGEIVSVLHYKDKGFLPEGFLNFIALLGWSPASGKEFMSLDEMIEEFDFERVQHHPAVYNFNEATGNLDRKLLHLNSEHLRQMPIGNAAHLVRNYLVEKEIVAETRGLTGEDARSFMRRVELVRQRAKTLEDFITRGLWAFTGNFSYDPEATKRFWASPNTADMLSAMAPMVARGDKLLAGNVEYVANAYGNKLNVLLNAMRVALTGQGVGPAVDEIITVLGSRVSAERLRRAADLIEPELSSEATKG